MYSFIMNIFDFGTYLKDNIFSLKYQIIYPFKYFILHDSTAYPASILTNNIRLCFLIRINILFSIQSQFLLVHFIVVYLTFLLVCVLMIKRILLRSTSLCISIINNWQTMIQIQLIKQSIFKCLVILPSLVIVVIVVLVIWFRFLVRRLRAL
jgi:hypothetical protein